MVSMMPTMHCLVQLVEAPYTVVSLNDIEIVSLERVGFNTSSFDLVVIFKDFSRDVCAIGNVPAKQLDDIRKWLGVQDIKFFESKIPLQWKRILKQIADDPDGFLEVVRPLSLSKGLGGEPLSCYRQDGARKGADTAAPTLHALPVTKPVFPVIFFIHTARLGLRSQWPPLLFCLGHAVTGALSQMGCTLWFRRASDPCSTLCIPAEPTGSRCVHREGGQASWIRMHRTKTTRTTSPRALRLLTTRTPAVAATPALTVMTSPSSMRMTRTATRCATAASPCGRAADKACPSHRRFPAFPLSPWHPAHDMA